MIPLNLLSVNPLELGLKKVLSGLDIALET